MISLAQQLPLEGFLQRPETQPASEFINGEIIQKPMPQGENSRIQGKFSAEVNQLTDFLRHLQNGGFPIPGGFDENSH